MTHFATDRFEPPQDLKDFCEHGHERGAGPSLFPDRALVDVSLDLDLDAWLAEKAFDHGLARAQLIRQILRREQRQDRRFKRRQKVDSTSRVKGEFSRRCG